MSGSWKTKLTMLTLTALVMSSSSGFAEDFKVSKPIASYDAAVLRKALKGGRDGKMKVQLTIPGMFNDDRQYSTLKEMGFYLDESDKSNPIVRHHAEGVAANPSVDPEVVKLHIYAGGNYGITGNAGDFVRSRTTTTIRRTDGGGGTYVGPAVSVDSSHSYMSDADIRAMLERAGIKDSAALDRLVKLFHDYLRNPNDATLAEINAELKKLGFDPNAANGLIISIERGNRSGIDYSELDLRDSSSAYSPGGRRKSYLDDGSSSSYDSRNIILPGQNKSPGGEFSFEMFNDPSKRQAWLAWARQNHPEWFDANGNLKPDAFSLTVQNNPGNSTDGNTTGLPDYLVDAYRRAGVPVPSSVEVTLKSTTGPGGSSTLAPGNQVAFDLPSFLKSKISDEAKLKELMDLLNKYKNGDASVLPRIQSILSESGLTPDQIAFILAINSGVKPQASTDGGSVSAVSVLSSGSNLTADPTEMPINGRPYLSVRGYDENGNLVYKNYKIVGDTAVDKDGKVIWKKNANGKWELVDGSKNAQEAATNAVSQMLESMKSTNGDALLTSFGITLNGSKNETFYPLKNPIQIDSKQVINFYTK